MSDRLNLTFLLCSLLFLGGSLLASETPTTFLKIHGSNTIGEKYAPILLTHFLSQKGMGNIEIMQGEEAVERMFLGSDDQSEDHITIELEAHGSSTGFESLLAGKAHIAMSSRPIKALEVDALKAQYPSFSIANDEHIIAYDALAIIVHADVGLKALTLEQLAGIFAGEFTNWQSLGGADQVIKLFARDDNSGTYDTFKTLVLKRFQKTLAKEVERFESSEALSYRVKQTAGAIGFVGVSHARQNRVIPISAATGLAGVVPNEFTVGTEDYPLSRKLYLYWPTDIEHPLANEFVQFALSEPGQKLAREADLVSFYPTRNYFKPQSETVNRKYKHLADYGRRLSVMIRLDENGGLSAKTRRDIERLVRFDAANPHNRLVLAGFWDDPDYSANSRQQVQQWIDIIKAELAKRSVDPWVVHGGFLPLGSAWSKSGNPMDRRIEVWAF